MKRKQQSPLSLGENTYFFLSLSVSTHTPILTFIPHIMATFSAAKVRIQRNSTLSRSSRSRRRFSPAFSTDALFFSANQIRTDGDKKEFPFSPQRDNRDG